MSKLYIENGLLPEPGLYLDAPEHQPLMLKSVEAQEDLLFLKGNPHRDPSVGQFMGGGTHKAHSGEGQDDLTDFVNTLMEKKK